ncbi:MAG: RNA 2',3'-cyclic phosphodiesterase [Candidatus Zixiibacteriota bacterium]
MVRLFIALPLPHEVEIELDRLLAVFRPKGPDVKWVPAKNIHLTVKFLGDTDLKLVPRITTAINQVASHFQPFETKLDRVGGFPNLNRPRVIWVGGSAPLEGAAQMAREIDHRMHELRFEKEKRPFKAHLTLGRVREGRRVDDLAAYLDSFIPRPIPTKLDRLVLFKSTLTPQGSIYERLHEAMLGQAKSQE